MFVGATVRYEVEFLSALVLLAVLGIMGVEHGLTHRPVWRLAARWGWRLLLAVSVAFNVFAIFGRYIETHILRETFFARRGQLEEAKLECRKILEIEPDNWLAASSLGGMLLQQGKVLEATRYLQQAVRAKPDFADACNNLGVALIGQGKLSEAIDWLERAVRANPDHADAHYNLGNALVRQNLGAAAIPHYEHALRIKPADFKAHNNLANELFRHGRVTEAVGHYEQALQLSPDYADARRNLGVALFRLAEGAAAQRDWAEAAALYERAAACARATGNLELAKQIEDWLMHYRAGRPYQAIPERKN
jgi:tetratricopeptide (TPR) repeat protein